MRPAGAAIAIVLAAALVGCAASGSRAGTATTARDDAPLTVRRGEFRGRFLLTGELQAVRSTDIVVPRTPSWQVTIRWLETDGAEVKQGQKVLELDNTQFVGDLEQKRLAEARTRNELAQKEADIAVRRADKEFEVERKRVELRQAELEATVPRELLPLRDHQEKQLQLERARVAWVKAVEDRDSFRESSEAELEVLRIELRKARSDIEASQRAIDALTLTAPQDGIVIVERNWREGRKFQVGDNAWVGLTVMRMPDLSGMQVEARLSDVDDGKIHAGMPATCTLDAYPGLAFPGHVTAITPVAQEHGRRSLRRAFRVTVPLERADPERMRPGMSAKLVLDRPYLQDVLVAPRAALDLDHDPPRARVAGGDPVEVTLGPCNAVECVVTGGLEEGHRLEPVG